MELRIFQKGFNYSQDGPGNRLVYHLQGCNMRCPWCANPEGLDPQGGKAWPVEALADEVRRSRSMFFDGGGVTFTGGEPTMQFEALARLLAMLKEMGVNTAIETNGTHPRLPELYPLLDHVMMDFKQPFPELHRNHTGVGSEVLLKNLTLAAQQHKDLLIRIPVIGGYNDSPGDMEEFARILAGLEQKTLRVELLRYHEYGKTKWEKLGREYTVRDAHISDERYRTFLEILHRKGLTTVTT